MADYSTTMHGPSASMGTATGLYAVCKVCGCQWQVWGDPPTNTKGCAFCNAPESAITVHSEKADYSYQYTSKARET